MNFKVIKRLSLALALLICLSAVLTSCGVKPIKSTEEEAAVIGKIGKYDVRYEELRYLVLNFKRDMALKYGEDIWTDPVKAESYKDELWSLVREKMVSDYYAVQAMADYYYVGGGAALMMNEKPILEAVQENVELAVDECGGFKKYKEMLASQYLTDNLFRFYSAAEECANELFYILVRDLGEIESSDEYIDEYFKSDDFLRTNHIFISGVSAENLAKAKDLPFAAEETISKIEKNIQRDKEVNERLRQDGWIVLRFWGRQIKRDVESCADEIDRAWRSRNG